MRRARAGHPNIETQTTQKGTDMAELSSEAREILSKKAFASVATINEDGSPQVTTVWIDADDEHVIFNTAKGRLKTNNLTRDPRVSVAVPDPDNPYNQLKVQGSAEISDEGADEHIDSLAKKYMDKDTYPFRQPGEERVIVRIKPDKVGMGP